MLPGRKPNFERFMKPVRAAYGGGPAVTLPVLGSTTKPATTTPATGGLAPLGTTSLEPLPGLSNLQPSAFNTMGPSPAAGFSSTPAPSAGFSMPMGNMGGQGGPGGFGPSVNAGGTPAQSVAQEGIGSLMTETTTPAMTSSTGQTQGPPGFVTTTTPATTTTTMSQDDAMLGGFIPEEVQNELDAQAAADQAAQEAAQAAELDDGTFTPDEEDFSNVIDYFDEEGNRIVIGGDQDQGGTQNQDGDQDQDGDQNQVGGRGGRGGFGLPSHIDIEGLSSEDITRLVTHFNQNPNSDLSREAILAMSGTGEPGTGNVEINPGEGTDSGVDSDKIIGNLFFKPDTSINVTPGKDYFDAHPNVSETSFPISDVGSTVMSPNPFERQMGPVQNPDERANPFKRPESRLGIGSLANS